MVRNCSQKTSDSRKGKESKGKKERKEQLTGNDKRRERRTNP